MKTSKRISILRCMRVGAGFSYWIYYAATGLHAIHLTVGLGVILWLMKSVRGAMAPARSSLRVEVAGLYWHFVDIVWVFLWPILI